MPQILLQFVLPLAFQAIQLYIKNSSFENDDKVLDLTKKSCQYLSDKSNNTMGAYSNRVVQNVEMVEGV